jgi:uncharacterized protein
VTAEANTAEHVIALLGLEPHPEGGHFRETFRDRTGPHGRAHSTAILYLLNAGERSHWHRVDAAETWHWYGGGTLRLTVHDRANSTELRLGPDWAEGEVPQAVVPAHAWQKAEPVGDWVLLGCTVAPGFEFAGFELAPEGWEP